MKILVLSQYFPPEMGAPAARMFELGRAWAKSGHDVTVLTGFPNHPTGVIPLEYRGQLFRDERISGMRVVRVPIYAAANRRFFRRVANYLSYGVSASVVGPLVTARPDVVVATSPQMLTAVAGVWMSWLRGVPFVFDVRDLWPRSIVEVGAMKEGSPAVRALEWLERSLYRAASRIVVVTHSFVDEIAALGIPRDKIDVVTNGVDLELFAPASKVEARRALGLSDRFVVSYVGTHGMAHGLDTLLDTAMQLRGHPIDFLLVGEGAEKARLKARAAELGLDQVSFWDQRPRAEVNLILAASDACLVMLRDRAVFRTVIPSKIFEVWGAGRPIVTTVDGESRQIIERAGGGIFSPPEDAAALANVLLQLAGTPALLEEMGRAGRAYVEKNYSRDALAGRYLKVLEDVRRRCDQLPAQNDGK